MPSQQEKELRQIYEVFVGRVADTTWRAVKRFLKEADLELNPTNLQEYASLRKKYPKLSLTALEFRAILAAFEKSRNSFPERITGQELVDLLHSQGISPDTSTIYRWFYQSGLKFNKLTLYETNTILEVLYRAVIWKFSDSKKRQKEQARKQEDE